MACGHRGAGLPLKKNGPAAFFAFSFFPFSDFRKADGGHLSVFILFSMACIFFLPVSSSGHAFPDHSNPKVGATVSGNVVSVSIWFDSDIEPLFSSIVVKNSAGKQVDKGDSHVDPSNDSLLMVSVPPLPPGTYHVYWNVVARDTHRTEGDFTFTVK